MVIAITEIATHFMSDLHMLACGIQPIPSTLLLDRSRTPAISFRSAFGFERCNFRRESLYFIVKIPDLRSKLCHVQAKHIRTTHSVQQDTQGVARQVRNASRSGHSTNSFESQVLLLGEPYANHSDAGFQDCHSTQMLARESGPRLSRTRYGGDDESED
jgi:hypothetical protein